MQSQRPPTVQFQVLPDNEIVEASHEESILESLLRHEIPLDHSCGGFGTCGTCRVVIVKGLEDLAPRNELEQEMATERGFEKNERLSCQTLPCQKLVIQRPTKDERKTDSYKSK